MKIEPNRIFISDLPETATEEEIQRTFGEYGEVAHVEIKERKELGLKNTSLFFAYVTLKADAKSLQKCFEDFSREKWLGQHVFLQIARESFLDRLKREREASNNIPKLKNTDKGSIAPVAIKSENKSNSLNKIVPKKPVSSSSDSSTSESDDEDNKFRNLASIKVQGAIDSRNTQDIEPDSEFVIKSNRGKTNTSKVLKIESVGKEPIIKIDRAKKKIVINTSEANLKRLESLKVLKKGYQNQKSLIQAALSKVDTKSNNKIVFDDIQDVDHVKQPSVRSRKSLFTENDSDEEFEPSFSVKEHFQGKKGQKLLELQSKFKNDKRFNLDERFLEDNETNNDEKQDGPENNNELSLEEEKRKEYEILEKILGKKIAPNDDKVNSSAKKSMLRFDPSQPDHTKFEIPQVPTEKKEKRKRKNSEAELIAEKKHEETSVPEVSKEVFFKVSDNLKQTFEETKEFSLLSMFGNREEGKNEKMEETEKEIHTTNNFHKEKNPFKYDSSDDEDEIEDIPDSNEVAGSQKDGVVNNASNNIRKQSSWTDPFFFKLDDYRLQEGFDFVEKVKYEEKTEFTKLRRDLKGIVKAKIRNNIRRNKPFKKKLGGSRKKKAIRIKKAMKR